MHYRFGSSVNLVVTRGTDFSQQVRLTTSRQASAPEQLINQRQKCRDTVVFQTQYAKPTHYSLTCSPELALAPPRNMQQTRYKTKTVQKPKAHQ